MATNILFGPPGTGKTTSLLRVVKMRIQDGLSPEQICFISFTRKAANEAKYRMMDQHHLIEEQLPWFRTLHSLAFQVLGFDRNSVMGLGDYIKLCELLGLSITYKNLSDDGTFAGQTLGDRLFFMENMARARMMDLKDYWDSVPDEDIYWYDLSRVRETLDNYKKAYNKNDFTDIINLFIQNGSAPPCEVLVVDEAQDLSPLQWHMVEKLMKQIPECYIAGDDDQAIFRWAGADVDHLIKLPGNQEILGKSFRVPSKIQVIANSIAKKIHNRVPKEWEARDEEGVVEHVTDVEHIDMNQGSWLLLARNAFLLDQYIQHCMREGYIFDTHRESLLKKEMFIAIRDWQSLMGGHEVPASSVKLIYDLMTVRLGVTHGFKGTVQDLPDRRMMTMAELKEKFGLCVAGKSWDVALDKMPVAQREYYLAAIARGEKFIGEPRIKISTIHGAKGGEADNVVVITDMAFRTYREFEQNQDDEHRVWYVAVTRARQRLIIVTPKTNMAYSIDS